ncbi:MAG TPA: DUF3106 domain-containing protein [Candidatus Angelobacter sp.]|nr:DUF3106 domain-containing protein [Candidatus Angelobacter sp.]
MIGTNIIAVSLLAGSLALNVPSRISSHGPRSAPILLTQAAPAQKSPTAANHPGQNNANRNSQRAGRKMGDWLQAHQNLPLDQQLKLLENDPNFKKLPPQRQSELRERLQKFNNLTPQKREQALQRMEFLSKLTPQQREDLRNASQQLQSLPEDRRVAVHKALRHLRQMPPDERKQVMESDRFKSTFSDQEQKLIGQLAEMNPQEGGSSANPTPK